MMLCGRGMKRRRWDLCKGGMHGLVLSRSGVIWHLCWVCCILRAAA